MRRGALARLMGSTVLSQAFLSGGGFLVAFILLRRLGLEPYGFYVLVNVALILLVSLQGAFFQVPVVLALSRTSLEERQSFVGGLMRSRARLALALAAVALGVDGLAWAADVVAHEHALLVAVGALTAVAMLRREFCRAVLLGHHRTGDVLLGDMIYVAILVGGTVSATFLPLPTVFAVASMGGAALVSGELLARRLWRFEPWDREGSRNAIRDIAAQGGWALLGAAVHWSFSQGYTYLVAALLDVRAVAVLAATRLLLMPLNLLSLGVNQALYPLVSRWHEEVGLREVLRRVVWVTAVLLVLGLLYCAGVWVLRDWFSEVVLRKTIREHEHLLLLWGAVFLVMLVRDQVGNLLVVRTRLRSLSQLTTVCSVLALLAIWLAVPVWGTEGAVISILIGEALNMLGMLILLRKEIRRLPPNSVLS